LNLIVLKVKTIIIVIMSAPIMMIGEKAADLIKGRDTVGQFRQKIASLKL
jgi:hypothetical protein